MPTVKAVHFPISGGCRFNCYISIDKKVDGETKQAALAALGGCDFVKHVVVVDADIDIYNEEEVLWAMATRVQADQDVDIIKNVKGNTLDPSQTDDIMTAKMIIDATKPVQRPYEARVAVPKPRWRKPGSKISFRARCLSECRRFSQVGWRKDIREFTAEALRTRRVKIYSLYEISALELCISAA